MLGLNANENYLQLHAILCHLYYLLFSFFSLLFNLDIIPENQILGNISGHFADEKTNAQGHSSQRAGWGSNPELSFSFFFFFNLTILLQGTKFSELWMCPLIWKMHKISQVSKTI